MFRYRHQLRRWAAQVLLLWLFGIGTGFANACLAPKLPARDGSTSPNVSGVATAHHDVTTVASDRHDDSKQGGHDKQAPDQPGSPGKTNCQDFCEKSEVTIPSLKSALDDLQGHALPLSAVAVALPMPAFQPAVQRAPRRDGVRVSSIPIVFLRLAL
jgi:hypothetical protein